MPAFQVGVFLGLLSLTFGAHLTSEYDHFVALDPAQKMKLYWTVNRAEKSISFAIEANTTGWVGFGFSTGTGRMKGADVVIGWVKEGKPYLTNRHAEGYFLPAMDDVQDTYKLSSGTEENGTTILKFSRKIDTCSKQDRKIEDGTTKVIFAYNDEDPESETNMKKHTYKGTRSLLLLSYGRKDNPDPSWSHIDMVMPNMPVSRNRTSYLCKAFKLPEFGGKRHIIRFEPVVQPGNEGFVHHFIVSECNRQFPEKMLNLTLDCLDFANMPFEVLMCKGFGDVVAAWGIGGGPFIYPDHVGYPVGMPESGKIYVMELHYDNPEMIGGRYDSSGVRLYYTDNLRTYDSGTWTIGLSVTNWMVIPPKQENWLVTGYCNKACTQSNLENSTLPEKGIRIFAVFLHTHLAGRGTWTKHIRNGVEVPEIARDNYYDFNFQEIQALPKEVHFRPGDELTHYCKYNTMDREHATYGGFGTHDEMCLTFLLYYPRLQKKLTSCTSTDYSAPYKFLTKHLPSLQNMANRYWNPLTTKKPKWTSEMASDLKRYYQESKNVYTEFCTRVNYTKFTDITDPENLTPKVVITKPLVPPATDCDSSAHAIRASLVYSAFCAWLVFVAVHFR